MRHYVVVIFLTLAVCAAPAIAQATEPEEDAPKNRLVAAGWCVLEDSADDPHALGCDVGVGVSLLGQHRLRWIAAVGTESVGTGIAWVASSTERGTIAVSLGIVAPYGDRGIIVDEAALAVGATFGVGGRSEQ